MDTLVNENLFLVLLAAGGVLVVLRARETYSTRLVTKGDDGWSEDETSLPAEIPLRLQTSNRLFATGFAVYLTPILLVYLLLSMSPELLTLSMAVAGTTSSVGALSLSSNDSLKLAPMFAATAIVGLFGVRPFSILERAIRRGSHDVAGIPAHFQSIVTQIEIELQKQKWAMPEPHSPATSPMARRDNLLSALFFDLAAIQQLSAWSYYRSGRLLWTAKSQRFLERYEGLIERENAAIDERFGDLGVERVDFVARVDALNDQDLGKLVRRSRKLRDRLTRLLALLIANQDRPLPGETVATDRTPEVLRELFFDAQRRQASSRHIDILAGTTLAGIIVGVPAVTLYYLFLLLLPTMWSGAEATLDVATGSLLIAGLPVREFFLSASLRASHAAWWDVAGMSLLHLFGCGTALVYRSRSTNHFSWSDLQARGRPVFQYVVVAMVSTVSAALAYEIFLMLKLVAAPSFIAGDAVSFALLLKDFSSDFFEFGVLSLVIVPSALAVCKLSDRFDENHDEVSFISDAVVRLLAITMLPASAVLYVYVRFWTDKSHELQDVMIFAPAAALFLFALCVLYWRVGNASANRLTARQKPGDPLDRSNAASDAGPVVAPNPESSPTHLEPSRLSPAPGN